MTVRMNPRPSCHPQVSYRLAKRRQIFECRRRTADCSLIFATCGIALMIVENELTAAKVYNTGSISSHVIKFFILVSTCLLLGTIVIYHGLEIKMFMIDNSCEDWRLAVDIGRVWRICVELLVCAICPIPGNFAVASARHADDGNGTDVPPLSVDVFLSIAMFGRLYLIFRAMLLHSRLYTDTASRSIGALNRIKFTTGFILKTLTTARPGTVLLVFTLCFWTVAAWIMNRVAELSYAMDDSKKHQNYLNSLWLIAITSLTVGYGDIVPSTYCGRTISGMATSSLVVAVVARKLELSRAEKHVNNFMFDSKLTKQVLRYTVSTQKMHCESFKHDVKSTHCLSSLKHFALVLGLNQSVSRIFESLFDKVNKGISL
ncbi:unnamed protein product [Soboliphyme baturini]|uniref:Ion_trans_2 domain-containing protein n=1 Tax=Soboliphyme baturini TaxID=241478 RepID=A0A183J2V7_9BILA|nr:unnamed protein product [Soboliphyme baturini]